VCCSGGQREVSQRLRLVQDLLLLIQPLKANLKRLRLLGIGLPLTILLGGLAALVLLDELEFWEAFVVAAVLAPTDAALGQVVVSSPRLPERLKQALDVEAGLNDGLSVPFTVSESDPLRNAAVASTVPHRTTLAIAAWAIERRWSIHGWR